MTVVGRADDRVNRSGYLILLSDIERVLEKFESVGMAAVVSGKAEAKRGERIVAFCVPQAGSEASGERIRQHCFDALPHYAIPDEVRVTTSLPLLPSGKIDRQALVALAGL